MRWRRSCVGEEPFDKMLDAIAIKKKKMLVNCSVNCQFALLPSIWLLGKQRKQTVYATVNEHLLFLDGLHLTSNI